MEDGTNHGVSSSFLIRVPGMQELLCYNKKVICLLLSSILDTNREKMKFSLVISYNSVRQISVSLLKKMPQKKFTLAQFGQFSCGHTCWDAFVFSFVQIRLANHIMEQFRQS